MECYLFFLLATLCLLFFFPFSPLLLCVSFSRATGSSSCHQPMWQQGSHGNDLCTKLSLFSASSVLSCCCCMCLLIEEAAAAAHLFFSLHHDHLCHQTVSGCSSGHRMHYIHCPCTELRESWWEFTSTHPARGKQQGRTIARTVQLSSTRAHVLVAVLLFESSHLNHSLASLSFSPFSPRISSSLGSFTTEAPVEAGLFLHCLQSSLEECNE